MRKTLAITILLCLFPSTYAFSQARNATVSGTVADASGAVLPGVSVTATDNATGVVTTVITNEAGAYNFRAACGPRNIHASSRNDPPFQTGSVRRIHPEEVGGHDQLPMSLEELLPCRLPGSFRRWLDAVPF